MLDLIAAGMELTISACIHRCLISVKTFKTLMIENNSELRYALYVVCLVYVRNGCKPFVEVYVGEERVLTTSQEYELIR